MRKKTQIIKLMMCCLSLFFWMGCGSSGNDNGTLSLGLTDAPPEDFSAVYITFNEIQVHQNAEAPDNDSGWITIPLNVPNQTINLLDLTNGVVDGLAQGPLAPGNYSQIRLIISDQPDDGSNILCHPHPFANYVIDADDQEIHELKIPSGEQSGFKIVCGGQCQIAPNQTTELILDFDAAASVVTAGNSGQFILKPTVKVLGTEDFTIVNGVVTNVADDLGIPEVVVSGQMFNPAAPDLKDVVKVWAKTSTDSFGAYQLFLKPGDYNLVAFDPSFTPVAVDFTALAGQVMVQDFVLTASAMGSISGNVTIAGISEPTFAHLSFRQSVALPGEAIQADSADVLSGDGYSVDLPVGDYQVVSSTCGKPTQEANATVLDGGDTLLDIVF